MIAGIATAFVVFAFGLFILWVLIYASGLVRPKVKQEGVTGAASMERKVLLAAAMVIGSAVWLFIYNLWDPARQASAKERQLDTSIHRGVENYSTLCFSCHGVDGKGAVVPGTDPPRVTPQLNREQFWSDDPDEYKKNYDLVYKTIQRGRPGTPMPAWGQTDGGTLNQEQIHELTVMILNGDRQIEGRHTTWEVVEETIEEHIAAGSPTPIPLEAAITGPPELRAGTEVFTKNGCPACHAIQGDTRLVGPSLAGIGERAATREPGKSADDYIKESVRTPSAFIVPTFPGPPSLMPPFGPAQISDQEMADLLKYLESLK